MKIILTGSNGRLGKELIKTKPENYYLVPLTRGECDLIDSSKIIKVFDSINPDLIIHSAALTNPLSQHYDKVDTSIESNIIATANIASYCARHRKKLIYISTDYVYHGKGPHRENEPLLPKDNYGWSKLGGECSTIMVPNSLILRCSFMEKPFRHNQATIDQIKSFLYIDEIAPIIWKTILKEETGIINIGGKRQSVYKFAKRSKPNIRKIKIKDIKEPIPKDTSLNLKRLKRVIKNDSIIQNPKYKN